jgi:hypothetical protein
MAITFINFLEWDFTCQASKQKKPPSKDTGATLQSLGSPGDKGPDNACISTIQERPRKLNGRGPIPGRVTARVERK